MPSDFYNLTSAARNLKRLLASRPAGDWFGNLCLLQTARTDDLVRETITVLFHRVQREGRLTLSLEAVMAFLREAEEEGKMPKPWSSETKRKVARGLLKMLTEFGFLAPRNRGP